MRDAQVEPRSRGRRSAKTDRLDARWLARLLAKEMLPQSWIPPAQIQELRDRTRLRKALAGNRRRWGQRLHAYLLHEGWPCSRSNLLRPPGLRWAAALQLREHARLQVDSPLSVMAALEAQLDMVDMEPAVGRSRSPSRPTIGAVEISIPSRRAAGCGASIALKRSRLGCD
jgi:transposase